MRLMENLKIKAIKKCPRIVFPEAEDIKIVQAAANARDNGIAKPILIGKESILAGFGINLNGIEVIDHENSSQTKKYANIYAEREGFPESVTEKMLLERVNFAAMMVGVGDCDGMVAGLTYTTEQVIMASQMFVGMAEGINTVSSYFLMEVPGWSGGEEGLIAFADCAVVPYPSSQELAEIAITTSDSVSSLLGWDPRVAMLSYSTKGSASHPEVDKIIKAVEYAKAKRPDIHIDGELQADAALVMEVAQKKVKGESAVAGKSNILIFPNLDAGNIAYKLIQRLVNAAAYGPILQGFRKPVSDLSRGATVEDIVGTTTIVASQY